MKRYTVKEIRKKVEKIEGEKSKTKKGLEEELVGIIEKIKNAGSSFEIAELSEEALNITEKIKEVRKRQESRFESEPEPKDTEILLLGDIVLCD